MDNFAFVALHYSNGDKKMIRVGRCHGVNTVVASQFANDSAIVAIAYKYNDFEYATSRSAINAAKRELEHFGITCTVREMDGDLYFLRDFYNTVFPL